MTTETNRPEETSEDFITQKKIKSLSGLSLAVWLFTNISYSLVAQIATGLSQHIYCSITAFVLSVFFGILILRQKFKRIDTGVKIVLISANIFLIYATSNGVQAVYSGSFYQGTTTTATMGFQLINTKPWWPDKQTAKDNAGLKQRNTQLAHKYEIAADSNRMISKHVEELRQLNAAQEKLINASKDDVVAELAKVSKEKQNLEARVSQLTNENNKLQQSNNVNAANYKNLYSKVDEFNKIRNLWKITIEAPQNKNDKEMITGIGRKAKDPNLNLIYFQFLQ